MTAGPDLALTDHRAMPFAFTDAHLQGAVDCTPGDGGLALQLRGEPWDYACTFAPEVSAGLAAAGVIELQVRVDLGSLAIGTLTATGAYFYDEAVLHRAADWQTVRLRVPQAESRGALVVRSAAEGTARARVRPVRFAPDGAAHQERDQVAVLDGLFASVAALDGSAKPGDRLASRATDAARAALGRASAQFGLQTIGPADPGFADALADLEPASLCALAQSLVSKPSAPRFPGWRFDWAPLQCAPRWQLRSAVWRAMRDRCPNTEIALPWLEDTYARMPLGSDLSLPLFTLGQFEPNIVHLLAPMIAPGAVFIDVGANEGLYTLLAAAKAGPKGLVVAVEPSRRELTRLRGNIAANGFENRVVVIEAALGRGAGWAEFSVAEASHGGQNAFADRFSDRIAATSVAPAPVQTLDMVCARLGSRRPDFVKIDVEGAEWDVLVGGRQVIEHARPVWLIEVARTGSGADARILATLSDNDYALIAIDDGKGAAVSLARGQAPGAGMENIMAIPREKQLPGWPPAP